MVSAGAWGLCPDLLDQVSPFHLVLDSSLTIRQVGSSLRRLCPQVVAGCSLESVVEVVSPRGPVTSQSLRSRGRSLFVLRVRDEELKLRGQMLHDEGADVVLFVGSPWITQLADIAARGMTLADLSVSDNLVDYLLLLQTQGSALEEARTLAESLQGSASALAAQAAHRDRVTRDLELVLNSAGEGIYGVDAVGTITFVNEAAARLVGVPRSQMLGRKVQEVIEADAPVADESAAAGHRQNGAAHPVVGRHRRADGSSFDSESISAPVVEKGQLVGTVVVFRDITERRAVERMKGEFVSMVSHELRTPLTSIRGALGLLRGGAAGELPPRAARMVEVANRSADRLIRLINDILDVERMTAGKLAVSPQSTSARWLLQTAAAEMEGLAESSGVRVDVDSARGVVLADPDRIVQTLNNLLSNALRASAAGSSVVLGTTVTDGHVQFDVRDTGSGIPADQIGRIFEPFQQVDGSDTRLPGGSGLGLAICRGLVEEHGGRIWLTSLVGEGTTASFTLPRARARVSR